VASVLARQDHRDDDALRPRRLEEHLRGTSNPGADRILQGYVDRVRDKTYHVNLILTVGHDLDAVVPRVRVDVTAKGIAIFGTYSSPPTRPPASASRPMPH